MTRWIVRAVLAWQALSFHPAWAAPDLSELVYMNRVVYTMRASVAGATPEVRAERALERLRALTPEQLKRPLTRAEVLRDNERAIALKLGEDTLLTVFARDLDPDVGATLDDVAEQAHAQLALALAARQAMAQPEVLLRGAAWSAAGLVAMLAAAWGLRRSLRAVQQRLEAAVEAASARRLLGIDWTDVGVRAVGRGMRVLGLAVVGLLAFLWGAHALRQFPATLPLADGLRAAIGSGLLGGGTALWKLLPDLVMVVLVISLARGVLWGLDQMFDGVAAGRLRVAGLHPETVRATRRLAAFGVWGLAVAAVYPFIPGSESAVFRGLSVFLGFMFTLGSAGVVSQWMHGLVIVYSRALRAGDFVHAGGHEGVVQELGALSVKIKDYRGNEITLPNSTVVAGSIVNHSRLAEAGRSHAAISLSIGYDVPWRQVHALLLQAAADAPGLCTDPSPRVLQRALSDFYIQYELQVDLAGSLPRSEAMSGLYERIQDVFAAAEVAILSPHFVALQTTQPPQAAASRP